MNDWVCDLKGKELLIHVERTGGGSIEGAGGFLKLSSYDGRSVLVTDDNSTFVNVYVDREDLEESGEIVLGRGGGGRVTGVDAQGVSFLVRGLFPQLVVMVVVMVRHVVGLRHGCTGRAMGGRDVWIGWVLGMGMGLALKGLDDSVVRRAAVVHEGFESRELDGYAAWQLLGRLLASLLGPVEIPGWRGRGRRRCARRRAATAVVGSRRVGLCIHGSVAHAAQPVVPGDVAAMQQNGLVVGVVAYVLEEDATAEGRDLQAGDVDVGMEVAPGVGADGVGHEGCEEAVEVEEEEDGQEAADEQFNEEHPGWSAQR